MEKAYFGGGCFWGVEAAFRRVIGVKATAVGYMGGHQDNPSYQDVCTDRTGHAEVVEVAYNPDKVTFGELLSVFWEVHDPTQVNRQGPDVGTQYRSAIFFTTPEQEAAAMKAKDGLNTAVRFGRPVATEVSPAGSFWRAEEYHQCYFEKQGITGHCGG